MDNRVEIKYIDSKYKFNGLTGRYSCMSILNNGTIKLFTYDNSVELEIKKDKVPLVRDIAIRDNGSLYVAIGKTGVGYIINKTLKER